MSILEYFKPESTIYNKDKSIKKGIYTFINPYSYFHARKNKNQLSLFANVFADGFIFVRFYNLFFPKRKIQRVSFDMTSIANVILNYACKQKKTVYFIGANKTEIVKAVNIISSNYSQLLISGFRDGYLQTIEEREVTQSNILALNPDILIVGMGTPKQEEFLIDIKSLGWDGIGFTCGGFFHQITEKLQYYPEWCDKYNLRWMYRLANEPHTRIRVLKTYSKFPFVFTYDYFTYKISKIRSQRT